MGTSGAGRARGWTAAVASGAEVGRIGPMTKTAPLTEAAPDTRSGSPSWRPLAGLLAVMGVAHFVVSRPFEAIVPRALGDPKPWVAASGVAELAWPALAAPRTRRGAGLASAVLFAAVFPANVQMTVTAFRSERTSAAYRAATVARLPLQVPLVLQALRIARRRTAGAEDPR